MTDTPDPSDRAADDDRSLRDLLRTATRQDAERAPELLAGVQARIRKRSRGRFYADGWSRAATSPATYVITAVLVLALLAVVYAMTVPGGLRAP